MVNKLWWRTMGEQDCHLVLLHGWGLNAEVWNCISTQLSSHFTLHLVDLPDFGRSYGFGAICIEEMAEYILQDAPEKAIWLGWSLGGLVASQVALTYTERVQALVTVASSPCFSTREKWPGINLEILTGFQQKLSKDFQRTIECFLILQTQGTETAQQDVRKLKNYVSALPMPNIETLNSGLEILKNVDLREPLSSLPIPHLRIYGYLDGLIPYKIAAILDTYWPQSESLVIRKAAHAPFISHPKTFCDAIISLRKRLYDL